jgi:hypothetical protein
MKTMLITFFNIKGTVHFEFIPQVQTVNILIIRKYWGGYMKLCVERDLKFGPTIGFSAITSSAHKALSVKQFLAHKSITEMEHSP